MILEQIKAAYEGDSIPAKNIALRRAYDEIDQSATENKRLRQLIEGSMDDWSQKLRWGLTGSQPECFAMMDMTVERYVKMRKALEEIIANDPYQQSSAGVIARRVLNGDDA